MFDTLCVHIYIYCGNFSEINFYCYLPPEHELSMQCSYHHSFEFSTREQKIFLKSHQKSLKKCSLKRCVADCIYCRLRVMIFKYSQSKCSVADRRHGRKGLMCFVKLQC